MGLHSKKCVPCEGGVQALSETDVNRLGKQVGLGRMWRRAVHGAGWAVYGC